MTFHKKEIVKFIGGVSNFSNGYIKYDYFTTYNTNNNHKRK